ncbi:MAG: lipopolysaccharide heptosyltransferase II [Verrucomicrobia bacterium]|nr:lipopolysaccharide heptosyltransferase II [Verrucomicrobiota bacterium]
MAARILVRGVNWLGDAVMTTPALWRLREAHPNANITILTDAKLADLWRHHPAVNSVLTFSQGESPWRIARRLREQRFEIGVALPNSPRSALELWLAGIPRRIGCDRPWRNFFLTQRAPEKNRVRMRKKSTTEIRDLIRTAEAPLPRALTSSAHQIFDYLHLVSHLGASSEPIAPFLAVTDEVMNAVVRRWQLDVSSSLFGLNPGAEYGPAKRWPVKDFIASAIEIQKHTNCQWLIFGGKSDIAVGNEIVHGLRNGDLPASAILNLAGETTLGELCALLKRCRLLLSNDTGPAHVAAAVGTPVIIPFGSTSPELTGPGLPGESRNHFLRANVPCSPCFLRECPIDFRCMRGITVDQVVEAVLKASGA